MHYCTNIRMEIFHNLFYNYQIKLITKICDEAAILLKNLGNLKYGKY